MNIAICISGVNDKNSNILKELDKKFGPGVNYYYHTFTNKTNLIPKDIPEHRLFTMHYPKWHYHPMESQPPCKHEKFQQYLENKKLKDSMYFGIVPILAHANLLKKIPAHHDLIVRVDWNTRLDLQVDVQHWIRMAYEKGPVGFMTRKGRGAQFGSGKWSEADRKNKADDWYGYLPSDLIIHRRHHFCHKTVREGVNEHRLYPSQWGWYQVCSKPWNDIHHSVHGFTELL